MSFVSVPGEGAAPIYAALDLGTNNCRLLVGVARGDGFRVLESYSRMVRLGEGLEDTGSLSAAAMERTLRAVADCARRLQARPARQVRAIATEACRRALNGAAFLDRVRSETGIAFETISPREEAELALESCASLLRADGGDRRALVFDIGGGSTELAWVRLAGDGATLIGYESLRLGVITIAERHGRSVHEPGVFEALVDEVASLLAPFEAVHCIGREIAQGGVRLLGTSGTATTLAGVVLDLRRYSRSRVDGLVMGAADASAAIARLRERGWEGLVTHPCVGPDRAELVLPGCAVVAAILRLWPAPRIVVADRGLREGVLRRMVREGRHHRRSRPAPPRHAAPPSSSTPSSTGASPWALSGR